MTDRGRTLEELARPRTAGPGVDVFAVEHDRAQVVWRDLPAGPVHLTVEGRTARVDHPGGPGSAVVTDLPSGRALVLVVRSGTTTVARRRFRTLVAPAGEELFRFATLNDLHLGRGEQGLHGKLRAVDLDAAHHPFVAARDAVDEALDWGARLLVVKGDICDETREWTWELAAKVFGGVPVPVLMIPGNHDTGLRRHFDPELGAARHGLVLTRGVDHVDVPGLRIVLVDSSLDGSGWGRVARHADAVADLAADSDTGVFIATHHQAQRFPVPTYWPHGIPSFDAARFARTVVAANPRALASSGHTHRCRLRRVAGLPWTEVAATNHFPAVWAGYRVHEGGIMQTVRRITSPDTLAWSEHTRPVLRGVWALWATGTPSDRSFTLDWA
jgi:hypothetical protein